MNKLLIIITLLILGLMAYIAYGWSVASATSAVPPTSNGLQTTITGAQLQGPGSLPGSMTIETNW